MKKLLSQPTSYFTKQPSSGEWEESQQNLLCTWWFLLAFVLVEKGGCVLSTRKLKLTPCITLVISFLNSSSSRLQSAAADWVYLSAGRCASAYGTHCAGLASGELSGFHRKGPMASKFAKPKPPGLSRLWDDVGGLSQAPSKTKVNHRTQALICRWSWAAFHRNQSTRLSKAFQNDLKMRESWRWTFRTLEVNANAWQIVHCDV